MKRYVNLARVALAILAYLLALGLVIYPVGMARRLWMAVTRVDAADRRRANASYLAHAGAWLRHVARIGIGLDITAHLRTNLLREQRPSSFVIVANHRSAVDAVTMPVALVLMRQTAIRWVVKLGVNWIPGIGTLMDDCGYAKVARHKDMKMLRRILRATGTFVDRTRHSQTKFSDETRKRFNRLVMAEFMHLVREDDVSVGIFPEGERFTGPKEGARRRHVGELVGKASFCQLCDALPNHGVAVVTVLWPNPPGGKTVFDVNDLCDRRLAITVDLYRHPENPDEFLERTFDRMDEDLGDLPYRSPNSG